MNSQIHVRVPGDILENVKEISNDLGYSSEQEYFRTALREKVEEDLKKKIIHELWKLKGSAKQIRKMTQKDRDRIFDSL
jgi:metal-responsive CopG/Arc/MetJ family transcriptional regulator